MFRKNCKLYFRFCIIIWWDANSTDNTFVWSTSFAKRGEQLYSRHLLVLLKGEQWHSTHPKSFRDGLSSSSSSSSFSSSASWSGSAASRLGVSSTNIMSSFSWGLQGVTERETERFILNYAINRFEWREKLLFLNFGIMKFVEISTA